MYSWITLSLFGFPVGHATRFTETVLFYARLKLFFIVNVNLNEDTYFYVFVVLDWKLKRGYMHLLIMEPAENDIFYVNFRLFNIN